MVKLSPDLKRVQRLEELQRQKKEKEEELKEVEEQKKKELDDVEKKLEEAVADLMSPSEEEMEADELEPGEPEHEPRVPESIEDRLREEREIQEGEGGPAYNLERGDLEDLPELYEAVKSGDTHAVEKAQNIIYELNKKDAYVSMSAGAFDLIERDKQRGGQYVARLESFLAQIEEQTNAPTYSRPQ